MLLQASGRSQGPRSCSARIRLRDSDILSVVNTLAAFHLHGDDGESLMDAMISVAFR